MNIPEPETINPYGPEHFDLTSTDISTEILLKTGSKEPIDRVILETPAGEFLKRLDIYSSQDNKNWILVKQGKVIFRQPNSIENIEIDLQKISCKFIKIIINDQNTKPIPFTGARLVFQTRKIDISPDEIKVNLDKQEIYNKKSRLTVMLPSKNLYLHHLELNITTSLFSRNITAIIREFQKGGILENIIGTYPIYRVSDGKFFKDESLTISINKQIYAKELILEFDNQDSPTLEITGIKAYMLPFNLIFQTGDNNPLILLCGNPIAEKPVYDLAMLTGKIKQAVFNIPIADKMQENPDYKQSEKLSEFTGVAGAIDVSFWKYRKAVTFSNKSFHRIEIDPEILAKCSSDLSDLRIVTGDHQLAYIIEKTKLIRPIELSIKEKKEDISEKTTHLTLTLPYSKLPINKLSFNISNSMFNRDVIIFEKKKDVNGTDYKNELFHGKVTKLPDQKQNTFIFDFNNFPETDTIHILVYNQDNEPLNILNFKAFYSVTYLIFKSNFQSGIHLYYYNPKANSPQYDIAIVSDEFLNVEKGDTVLGKEELLKSNSVFSLKNFTQMSGALFWGVLLFVFIMLIVIIRKLLS